MRIKETCVLAREVLERLVESIITNLCANDALLIELKYIYGLNNECKKWSIFNKIPTSG